MNAWSVDNFINLDHKLFFQCLEWCLLIPHAHTAEAPSISLQSHPSPLSSERLLQTFAAKFPRGLAARAERIASSLPGRVLFPSFLVIPATWHHFGGQVFCVAPGQMPKKEMALESCLTQTTGVLQDRTTPLPRPQEAQAQASRPTMP